MTNFAIFIISHARVDKQVTLKSLIKSGYPGDWYIVVDDLDPQLKDYQSKFGDNLLVFNKESIRTEFDTMDNFANMSSAMYARNYCTQKACELGIKYFGLFDDDIEHFVVRYDDDGSLISYDISDINKFLDEYIHYMDSYNISCVGFGNEGGYIGGTGGKFSKGYGRHINQAFIVNSNDSIDFPGTQNEDFNACCKHFDKVFIELYSGISISTPPRSSNSGGNNYANAGGLYVSNFYSVMMSPSFNEIFLRNGNVTLYRNWDAFVPKIISDRFKVN